ncbi:MAG: hypothetical protein GEU98_03950 [Pseudonocardiaceae bacterium]|nr:hypothetical protein [Pseudonocardiaceae bacterium]
MDRVDKAAAIAEGISGRSFDDLVERAAGFDDDRRLEIIGRALQAAALSDYEPAIRALGRALATGALAEDSAKVDESLRIV